MVKYLLSLASEAKVRRTGIVGYADIVAEGMAGLEEALDVVIDSGGGPRIETGFGTLRLIIHSGMDALGIGVAVGDISAITGIVGELGDERTP